MAGMLSAYLHSTVPSENIQFSGYQQEKKSAKIAATTLQRQ